MKNLLLTKSFRKLLFGQMDFTKKKCTFFLITIFFSLLQPSSSNLNSINATTIERIHIGVILDMQSWVGKIVDRFISMAISDFHSLNSHYETRLVLYTRDSEGDPLLALSQGMFLPFLMKISL